MAIYGGWRDQGRVRVGSGLVPRGRAGGFSVIEMAVVLSIAGILLTMAVWRFGPALHRARTRQAVASVAADLQYAKMLAARQREPVIVIVNPSLQLLLVRSRGGTIFRQRFVGPDTEFGLDALTAAPVTSVEVFPNGVATSPITLTASLDTYSRQVRLSRAGQIRVLP
jgi:prepilin-type N-terminal cleavage/methylation domain-containing protein